MTQIRPRLNEKEYQLILDFRKQENSNVLIIGDLHEPFTLKGYLNHCIKIRNKYNCNKIVFIGDIIDNHYSSFHTTDPDGYGAGEELDRAINKISKWYETFPNADVIIGNHDAIISRQAKSSGISKNWLKSYSDVLNTPNWNFIPELFDNNILYRHGLGQKASPKSLNDMVNIVQGHFHTEAYVHWKTGKKVKVFGMQVGCGIDKDAYAMAYAKAHPHPSIGCGVIIENGTLPIIEMMEL